MDNQQPSVNYRSIKKNALKYPVNIGEIYGMYKVVDQVKVINNAKRLKGKISYVTLWKCENLNTGKIILSRGSELHHLRERAEAKHKQQNQLGFRNYLYGSSKRNAKKRGHKFLLTFEEFNEIISKPCFYCGEEPRYMTTEQVIRRGDTHQPPIRYNGIDRLDPNGDYVVSNCVPCCPVCNYMKHTQQYKDFLNHVSKIYHFCIDKGSTTIPKGSTLQANGGGNGEPVTCKNDGEDIVSTSVVIQRSSLENCMEVANPCEDKLIQSALKAENQVKEAEANAKIAIAKAKGNAEATKIKADAEAYYNRTIAASLSPLIIQEDMIEKWNGELPKIAGGGGMILDVNKIVK